VLASSLKAGLIILEEMEDEIGQFTSATFVKDKGQVDERRGKGVWRK
jgi:hypothetical protein